MPTAASASIDQNTPTTRIPNAFMTPLDSTDALSMEAVLRRNK